MSPSICLPSLSLITPADAGVATVTATANAPAAAREKRQACERRAAAAAARFMDTPGWSAGRTVEAREPETTDGRSREGGRAARNESRRRPRQPTVRHSL